MKNWVLDWGQGFRKLPEVAWSYISKSDAPDFANSLNKKPPEVFPRVSNWVQGLDLNQRPSGYEPVIQLARSQRTKAKFGCHLVQNFGRSEHADTACLSGFQRVTYSLKGGRYGTGT